MSETGHTVAWLKQRLGADCEEVLVQGDQPLLLIDPSCAYVTLSEQHQLFCVGYENGAPRGRREHIAMCRPGQLLFGLEPSSLERTALALSGVTGSSVWRIPTARLFRLLDEPGGEGPIEAAFDAWLQLLIETLPPAPAPTRSRALTAGQTIEAEAVAPVSSYVPAALSLPSEQAAPSGTRRVATEHVAAFRALDGLLWASLEEPPRVYRGVEIDPARAEMLDWPLTEDAWLLCGKGLVSVRTSRELLRQHAGSAFAVGFYEFVIGVVAKRRAHLKSTRLERDRISRRNERDLVAESLVRLAAAGRPVNAPVMLKGDAFEHACRTLFQHLGRDEIGIVKASGKLPAQIRTALARNTRIRTREVALEKSWYQHDSGALLGFLTGASPELEPVALLRSPGGYELHSARSAGPRRLTRELAQSLDPRAFQFYPALPNRAPTALEVLKFACQGSRRDVVFTVVVGLSTGCVGTLIPLLTGQVFDRIVPGAELSLLGELTLVLLSTYAAVTLLDLARALSLVRVHTRIDSRLEAAVWDRLLDLPVSFFRRYSAGELWARAAGVGEIRRALTGTSLAILLGGLVSLGSLGLLFYLDVRLALAAAGLVTVAVLAAAGFAHAGLERERRLAELDGKISGLLVQLFRGITQLRVSASENRAFAVWANLFAKRRDADLRAERVRIRVDVFESAFPVLALMALFWLVAGTDRHRLSTGEFLAFSVAFATFLRGVLDVVEAGLGSLKVFALYARAKPILTEPLEGRGASAPPRELAGGVELSHVSFRYDADGPLVLDDLTLRIAPGEFVAIVGASGSGKSTLLRLLLGFEVPSEGGIFYDGQALARMDPREVRRQMGVVLQNSELVPGDILSNIVGNTGLDVDAAWEAARQAALAEDIRAMPMGMRTVISQGGGTLSGGQRQRLLIARALAHDPRLLLLDEATSALDNVAQNAVSESLDALRITRVVIAHRLSTIERADRIIVLERGRVVEIGRFAELIARKGAFAALARPQMP